MRAKRAPGGAGKAPAPAAPIFPATYRRRSPRYSRWLKARPRPSGRPSVDRSRFVPERRGTTGIRPSVARTALSAQVPPGVGFLGRLLPAARAPDRFLVCLLDLCGLFLLLLLGLVPLGLAGVLLGVSRHGEQRDDRSRRKNPHFSLPGHKKPDAD